MAHEVHSFSGMSQQIPLSFNVVFFVFFSGGFSAKTFSTYYLHPNNYNDFRRESEGAAKNISAVAKCVLFTLCSLL